MLRVVILYKMMPNRVNSLKEGHKTSLQNAHEEKGIHFPFKNAKCCLASMTDPCPNVDFDRVFGLLPSLVTTGPLVYLYLDSSFICVNDIFQKHALIFLIAHASLLFLLISLSPKRQ